MTRAWPYVSLPRLVQLAKARGRTRRGRRTWKRPSLNVDKAAVRKLLRAAGAKVLDYGLHYEHKGGGRSPWRIIIGYRGCNFWYEHPLNFSGLFPRRKQHRAA